MRKLKLFIPLIFLSVTSGCSNSHAIQCTMVGEQRICFVRQFWGFSSEKVSLTTDNNICHKPDSEMDYVSNGSRSNDLILAKIVDEKLYVYAETMDSSKKPFPVEVIFQPYDPLKNNEDFIKDGYKSFDLSEKNMTWCFSDVF